MGELSANVDQVSYGRAELLDLVEQLAGDEPDKPSAGTNTFVG